jgi:AcrR family transcriptional regulator
MGHDRRKEACYKMRSEEFERAFEPLPVGDRQRASDQVHASYDERLSHILEAATDLIARVGYERASMRAVAKAAGVSLAGLYHYFDSKERMLFLIQFRAFSSLVNRLREKLHGVEDPIEQLRVMIRTHVGYFAANMAALKVCSHELDSLSGASYEETRRIRREYYELARAVVDRLLAAYAPGSTLDGHVATMSLFGMLNWLYRWYDPQRGGSPAAVASQLATQMLHGVLGEASVPVRAMQDYSEPRP